jgi:hypothetical protein
MPSVYYSAVLPAPIETVWAAIRDFKALPDWHPAFCNSTIEDGRSSDAVGCVRSFHLKDGGHLREKLLALSDRNHTCTYAILESPLPLTDYVSTLRLLPHRYPYCFPPSRSPPTAHGGAMLLLAGRSFRCHSHWSRPRGVRKAM